MLAVGFEVEEIVDDVGRGGTEAEADEGYECTGEDSEGQGVGQGQREEDEDIFRPLVDAESLEPGFEGRDLLGEGTDGSDFGLAEGSAERRGRIGDHGLSAGCEERKIGQCVADVGKVVAELFTECS